MENGQSTENVGALLCLPNTDNKYAISLDGDVFRFKAGVWKKVNGEINHGYRRVNISINGVAKKYRVHRLVATEFVENPFNKPHVNHKDGNKLNNHFSNLEWCTASENEHHSYKVLGKVAWKTKPEQVRQKAYEMRKSGVKVRDICKSLNVSKSFVEKLVHSYSQTNK
jgi:hypothetical protein